MDLSKIEGLTEEQSAAITAMYNTDTEGLRNKNDELIGEKRTMQTSVTEQAQQVEDARLAAATAKEQALKSANDMDGLKTHYEDQLATATATANELTKTAQDALQSRDYGASESNLLGMFHNDHKEVGEALLSKGLKIGYNSEQQPVPTFTHGGEVVATGIDEIKSWAGNSSVFKQYLNGVDSSGADTTKSRASGSETNMAGLSSAKSQMVNAAVTANPKLKDLPIR